jgi:spermidine/putrescine transport system permease protein
MIKNIKLAYSLLSPSLIWLLVFLVVPVAMIAFISFTVSDGYGGTIYEFSISSYKLAFSSFYLKIIWQSALWALSATLISLVMAYPFAYFIARVDKWKNVLLILVMIPFWSNLIVRLYSWTTLLNDEGIINNILLHLGLISEPIKMLYTPFAMIVGMVYGFLPFMILPLYSSIEQLNQSYLEAAEDLGATPVKTFLKVTLPLTFPGIIAGFMITFIPEISIFVVADLLGGNKQVMIGNVIRDSFLVEMNWQLGAALSILLMVLVLLSVFLFMKFTSSKDRNLLF